jgi:hypothetical protein
LQWNAECKRLPFDETVSNADIEPSIAQAI